MKPLLIVLLIYSLALPGIAQKDLPTLTRDIAYIYRNLGFQSNALCVQRYQGMIDAFAKQVRGITKSVRDDASAFYDCAIARVSSVEYTKNTIAEAAKSAGLRCNAWEKDSNGDVELICQKGQIRTRGYWSVVQLKLVSMGSKSYAVLAIGIESRKLN